MVLGVCEARESDLADSWDSNAAFEAMTADVFDVFAGSLDWAAAAVKRQSRMQQGGLQDSIPWALVLIAPPFNDQIVPAVTVHTGPNLNRFDPIDN
jgi:hypothetical protein